MDESYNSFFESLETFDFEGDETAPTPMPTNYEEEPSYSPYVPDFLQEILSPICDPEPESSPIFEPKSPEPVSSPVFKPKSPVKKSLTFECESRPTKKVRIHPYLQKFSSADKVKTNSCTPKSRPLETKPSSPKVPPETIKSIIVHPAPSKSKYSSFPSKFKVKRRVSDDPKKPEVKPADPSKFNVKRRVSDDSKKPEVKLADPKQPEVKPADPKQPEVKPADPKQSEVKPADPKQPEVAGPRLDVKQLVQRPVSNSWNPAFTSPADNPKSKITTRY
ncbi:hypothetical protein HNY73_011648, partial [Argiope bruennichi]